jgi:hypothetical protein
MTRPQARITSPRPSVEEMVRELDIPETRQKELRVLVKSARKKWRTPRRDGRRSLSRR